MSDVANAYFRLGDTIRQGVSDIGQRRYQNALLGLQTAQVQNQLTSPTALYAQKEAQLKLNEMNSPFKLTDALGPNPNATDLYVLTDRVIPQAKTELERATGDKWNYDQTIGTFRSATNPNKILTKGDAKYILPTIHGLWAAAYDSPLDRFEFVKTGAQMQGNKELAGQVQGFIDKYNSDPNFKIQALNHHIAILRNLQMQMANPALLNGRIQDLSGQITSTQKAIKEQQMAALKVERPVSLGEGQYLTYDKTKQAWTPASIPGVVQKPTGRTAEIAWWANKLNLDLNKDNEREAALKLADRMYGRGDKERADMFKALAIVAKQGFGDETPEELINSASDLLKTMSKGGQPAPPEITITATGPKGEKMGLVNNQWVPITQGADGKWVVSK
jgi:hypothetical protein